ncbi:fasciclin domain-containing protein [Oscillatoria acuminata]|uniref:Secreted/surface protein with fasciclin-like repeats n=1 Tax=Oscillatoria acuminata PCC 6304 TaxID=56110 RepID=K9TK26_9CYAN|nr:fasciclin domain-containing protein [Oscillatoria acuminata]AFY82506.1 secreted/surface protein with fasciclin-like repeats [Oscillatoria acuminata PCC 6304]
MNSKFWNGFNKKVTIFLSVAGTSLLMGLPVVAEVNTGTENGTASDEAIVESVTETPESTTAMSQQTIAEIAAGSDSFTTLTTALEVAGLTDTLSGEGPFTVFAPTDEAFAALPEGTLEQLLQPENRALLVEILTYHVVEGSVMSGDLSTTEVPSVEGRSINVTVDEGSVRVNSANVVQADIEASNGVIHVIDQVIIPPQM